MRFILLFILPLLWLAGCTGDTPSDAVVRVPTTPLRLEPYTFEDSAALRTHGPYFTYRLHTLEASGGDPALRQLINDTLAARITHHALPQDSSLEAVLPHYVTGLFDDYLAQPVDEGMLQESAAPYTQEAYQETEILYDSDSLLVLSHLYYEYMGGAHGMSFVTLLPFGKFPPRRITYDQLFRPDSRERLSEILTLQGQRQGDGLYVDTVPVTTNVAPLPGGMRFMYEPYAIAPYASGNIAIDVPYDSLRGLLAPQLTGLLPGQ